MNKRIQIIITNIFIAVSFILFMIGRINRLDWLIVASYGLAFISAVFNLIIRKNYLLMVPFIAVMIFFVQSQFHGGLKHDMQGLMISMGVMLFIAIIQLILKRKRISTIQSDNNDLEDS